MRLKLCLRLMLICKMRSINKGYQSQWQTDILDILNQCQITDVFSVGTGSAPMLSQLTGFRSIGSIREYWQALPAILFAIALINKFFSPVLVLGFLCTLNPEPIFDLATIKHATRQSRTFGNFYDSFKHFLIRNEVIAFYATRFCCMRY